MLMTEMSGREKKGEDEQQTEGKGRQGMWEVRRREMGETRRKRRRLGGKRLGGRGRQRKKRKIGDGKSEKG